MFSGEGGGESYEMTRPGNMTDEFEEAVRCQSVGAVSGLWEAGPRVSRGGGVGVGGRVQGNL